MTPSKSLSLSMVPHENKYTYLQSVLDLMAVGLQTRLGAGGGGWGGTKEARAHRRGGVGVEDQDRQEAPLGL